MGWIFTRKEIKNSPSVNYGMEEDDEMVNRQEAALFIDKLGFGLGLNNYCVVTAIIFMHRFYMCHPFVLFPWNSVCCAAVLLATKLEEDRRQVEYITGIANYYLVYSEYDSQSQHELLHVDEVKQSEEILLSTVGFDLEVLDTATPQRLVPLLCAEVDVPRNVAHISYMLATSTIYCTTLVLQYRPKVIACFCLYQACKWTDWKILNPYDTKEWYYAYDETVNRKILEEMSIEFQNQYKRCLIQLKQRFMIITRFINDDIAKMMMSKPLPYLFYPEFTKPTVIFDFDSINTFDEIDQESKHVEASTEKEEKINRIPFTCKNSNNKTNSEDKKTLINSDAKDSWEIEKENQMIKCNPRKKKSGRQGKK